MGHGDAHGVVASGDGVVGQTVPLGAQHDGQLALLPQAGILDAEGGVAEGHGHRFEAQGIEAAQSRLGPLGGVVPDAGPGDLEHGAHAHPGDRAFSFCGRELS